MEEKKKIIITQSMMKEFYDYFHGNQCGLVFVEKYINKRYDLFPASKVQQMGNYFEYKCIGATTKSNKIPEPEYLKDGKTLTEPYKRMEAQVENYKNFMTYYGIEIVSVQTDLDVGETEIEIINKETGEPITFKVDGLNGTTDAICKSKYDIKGTYTYEGKASEDVIINAGEEFIMDIKTTGLLSEKYSDYGWDLSTLSQKSKIIRQPIHYKYLSQLKYGRQYKFLFLLFSTTNDYDFRSILFNIDEEQHIREHEEFIVWTNRWIRYNLKHGFKAHPDVIRCHSCPLKVGCKYFLAVPKIQVFTHQPQTT